MSSLLAAIGPVALIVLSADADSAATHPTTMPLATVRTFMYQLQNLEAPGAIAALAASKYDLLVVEATALDHGNTGFNLRDMVARLHAGKSGRIVVAYVDIGEAETSRLYWQKDWLAPTKRSAGQPNFILAANADGWADDYSVAYWDARWQAVITTSPDSVIAQLMRAGFDGVYLDEIDNFEDDTVIAEAKRQHINPASAMVNWIATIRKAARAINPSAIVIAQNGGHLLAEDRRYADVIDGIAFEDTWFHGKPNAAWGKPSGGDLANRPRGDDSTDARVRRAKAFQQAGKPVFTVDYCLKPENAAYVYARSRQLGFVPLVTQVSLSEMTETPPP